MRAFSVLSVVLLVGVTIALSLLTYVFVFQTIQSKQVEAPSAIALTLHRHSSEISVSGTTKICLYVTNAGDPVPLSQATLIVTGNDLTQKLPVYSPDCNEIASGHLCTLCADAIVPKTGRYSVSLVLPSYSVRFSTNLSQSQLPDLSIKQISVSSGLSFGGANPSRYDDVLFTGDSNSVYVDVNVVNVGVRPSSSAVIKLSGPCIVDVNVSVPALDPGNSTLIHLETNATAPGPCVLRFEIIYEGNELSTSNNVQNVEKNVYVIDFCDGCDDEEESCGSALLRHADKNYTTVVLLTRDDNSSGTCITLNPAFADLSHVIFDGNGHEINGVKGVDMNNIFGLTLQYFKLYTSGGFSTTAMLIRNSSVRIYGAEINSMGTTLGSGIFLTDANVYISDANVHANPSSSAAILASAGQATLSLNNVNLSGTTYISLIDGGFINLRSAANVYCEGKPLLFVTSANAGDYNNSNLDPSQYCAIYVRDVNDLNISFTAPANPKTFYLMLWNSSVRLHDANITTSGYYTAPLALMGNAHVVVSESNFYGSGYGVYSVKTGDEVPSFYADVLEANTYVDGGAYDWYVAGTLEVGCLNCGEHYLVTNVDSVNEGGTLYLNCDCLYTTG